MDELEFIGGSIKILAKHLIERNKLLEKLAEEGHIDSEGFKRINELIAKQSKEVNCLDLMADKVLEKLKDE